MKKRKITKDGELTRRKKTALAWSCNTDQIRSDLFVIKGHWPLTHHWHITNTVYNSNYTKYIECIGYRHKLTCNIIRIDHQSMPQQELCWEVPGFRRDLVGQRQTGEVRSKRRITIGIRLGRAGDNSLRQARIWRRNVMDASWRQEHVRTIYSAKGFSRRP